MFPHLAFSRLEVFISTLRPLRRGFSLFTESSAVGIRNLGLSFRSVQGRVAGLCNAQGGCGVVVILSCLRGMRSSSATQPMLVAHLGFPLAPWSGAAPVWIRIRSCVGSTGALCPKL